ncbi:MAG: GAF domain-containing protein [Cuspidothrix sp.]
MKKPLLSAEKYINNLEQLHPSSSHLMQHQEEIAHVLVKKINTIIANNTVTSSLLPETAYTIGTAFNVDCCLVTAVSHTSDAAITAHWCNEEFLNLSPDKETISQKELLFDLPVVQCADKKLTIEDISIIQKTLVSGWQDIPLPMKSVLAISTRFSGYSNGVISLIKFTAYEWQESEIKLLQFIDSCCAIAFAQVVQSQKLASQEQALHKANQHQSLIQKLTILNRSNLGLNQMLQLVITAGLFHSKI